MRERRFCLLSVALVAAAAMLSCGGVAGMRTSAASSVAAPHFDHVVVVVEENHSYSQVVGNPAMPYFNSLVRKYGLATHYFADTHPSIGNYMMLTAGDVLTTDDTTDQTFSAPTAPPMLEFFR